MRLIVDIPDKHRLNIKKKFNSKDTIDGIFDYLKKVEKASIEIIPDNATNGEIMEKVFGKEFAENIWLFYCKIDWWNAPYKKGEEE